MPWDITIIKGSQPGEAVLGSLDAVVRQFTEALPGADVGRPPAWPEELLAKMRPAVREAVTRPRFEAVFSAPGIALQFYWNDKDPVADVLGEVRGDGDPLPALRALCESAGWSVWDSASGSVVDLAAGDDRAWRQFCEWRDRAIQEYEEGRS